MTILYSPDGKNEINSHPEHVFKRLAKGWTLKKPESKPPVKKKPAANDKK